MGGRRNLIKAPIDPSKPGFKILDQATANGEHSTPVIHEPSKQNLIHIPGLWLKDVASIASAQHEYVGTHIVDSYHLNPQ
ncbi:hypothetical protein NHQ30_004599 [Ciborinia camelliae]|nr:hypothetical protein NHQ30_004599 [Ciborinia camelliae]